VIFPKPKPPASESSDTNANNQAAEGAEKTEG